MYIIFKIPPDKDKSFRSIKKKIFNEKYVTTLTIFINAYLIAEPFNLKYANGITVSASTTNI